MEPSRVKWVLTLNVLCKHRCTTVNTEDPAQEKVASLLFVTEQEKESWVMRQLPGLPATRMWPCEPLGPCLLKKKLQEDSSSLTLRTLEMQPRTACHKDVAMWALGSLLTQEATARRFTILDVKDSGNTTKDFEARFSCFAIEIWLRAHPNYQQGAKENLQGNC